MRTSRRNVASITAGLFIAFSPGAVLGTAQEATPEVVETPTEKLRRTLQNLLSLAKAIDGYSIDNNLYPRPKCEPDSSGLGFCSAYDLGADLKIYARGVAASDNWGNPYLYWHTPDGQHYAVVSTGSDGTIDDVGAMQELLESCVQAEGFIEPLRADCFESDLVFCDGQARVTAADVVQTCR